mmetsp:Transcript_8891/g.16350  ORF Transcript_8891/g.16350 Transcript_8891/m.16350 type:complete len:344 (-) Transcript_8891:176-1207(-)
MSNYEKTPAIWQDREIKFDTKPQLLRCRTSEEVVDTLEKVEDSKGSNNEMGRLTLTNLRLTWMYTKENKTNLSVGLDTIRKITIQEANPKQIEPKTVLTISAKSQMSRFEFIFSCRSPGAVKVFRILSELHKSYNATRMYRDLKLRGCFIKNKRLILLPQETIVRKVPGVWNLSADQGNLGTFFVTNVRVIWYAEMAENFNISIPYMQLTNMALRSSRFGRALVMRTTATSGNYTLGFRIDPESLLKTIHQEMSTLWQVYSKKPNFGVRYKASTAADTKELVPDEDVQIVRTSQMDHFDALTRYFAEPGHQTDRKPVYDPYLGLAVEQTKADISISKLWAVVV